MNTLSLCVHGSAKELPLKGFPDGKATLNIREGHFVTVDVVSETEEKSFFVKEVDGFYEPEILRFSRPVEGVPVPAQVAPVEPPTPKAKK